VNISHAVRTAGLSFALEESSCNGTQATIVVPRPGLLVMSTLPPSRNARCRMLA
jgi:hypothetical protein